MRKIILKDVKFDNEQVIVYKDKYPSGNTKLTMDHFDAEIGGFVPYMTLTMNIPIHLEDNHVVIKNYSENKDAEPWLFSWDVITPTGKILQSDMASMMLYKVIK